MAAVQQPGDAHPDPGAGSAAEAAGSEVEKQVLAEMLGLLAYRGKLYALKPDPRQELQVLRTARPEVRADRRNELQLRDELRGVEAMTLDEKKVLAEMLGLVVHRGELRELVPATRPGRCDGCAFFDNVQKAKDCDLAEHQYRCGHAWMFIKWKPKP